MGEPRPVSQAKKFGQYLRQVRERRRLSLDAVEEMTMGLPGRVTKSHLSRIENGQAEPTFPRMFALSQIYGVPIASLAERFESDLRLGLIPDDLPRRTGAALIEEAERLKEEGRYADALVRYEILCRRVEQDGADIDCPLTRPRLRLRRISCLTGLYRYAIAKDECEELLASDDLEAEDRIRTLLAFAECSYRQSRHSIAMLAIRDAEEKLGASEEWARLRALVHGVKGNLHYVTRQHEAAAEAFLASARGFAAVNDEFEATRQRMNYAAALAETGKVREARRQMEEALRVAQKAGFERQQAYALGTLGLIAFRAGEEQAAEAFFLQSNALARPNDYVPILFRNAYYLWQLARSRNDSTSEAAQRRTIRRYLNRVPEHLDEAREYRAFEGGGES